MIFIPVAFLEAEVSVEARVHGDEGGESMQPTWAGSTHLTQCTEDASVLLPLPHSRPQFPSSSPVPTRTMPKLRSVSVPRLSRASTRFSREKGSRCWAHLTAFLPPSFPSHPTVSELQGRPAECIFLLFYLPSMKTTPDHLACYYKKVFIAVDIFNQ